MAINKDTGDPRGGSPDYAFDQPLVDPNLIGFTDEWPDSIDPSSPLSEKFIVPYGIIDQLDLYDYIIAGTFREAVLLMPGLHLRRQLGHVPAQSAGLQTAVIQRDSDAQDRSRTYELV